MSAIMRPIRLYLIQAWFSYRSLYLWNTPFNYFVSKFGYSFSAMLMFMFIGKFAGLANPVYIVIGNILLMPSLNGISGVSMAIANEKRFGTLSYLFGSPAGRAPVFWGRALFPMLDGFMTAAVAMPVALLIFQVDLSKTNFWLLLGCILLISFTTSGLGFILGSISLVNRDGWMITSTIAVGLYILVGVNFSVDLLPPFIRVISYGLPMTRGILAARMALAGANWASVSQLVFGEIIVGIIYAVVGYILFRLIERRSLVAGAVDNL
ncbi:MAG: ABC transporter permease [Anaerolineaceae bacterium]|nr:ABC transporter permease [Anaerolineaceae bacterium]